MAAEKKKIGRPKKEIDWNLVDSLCEIQCTGPEIASVLKVNEDTMTNACKRDHNMTFSEYIKKRSLGGKMSLRRMQYLAAQKGNVSMLIWLGKQYLGQTEKQGLDVGISEESTTISEMLIQIRKSAVENGMG